MRARPSDRLLPWIAGSLLLLGLIVFTALQVPDIDCGDEEVIDQEPAAQILMVVTVVAVGLAFAGALLRLVTMAARNAYARRDGWILLAVGLVLAVGAAYGGLANTVGGGLALGGFAVAGLGLAALAAAALRGMDASSVGLLLPIYLLAAAWVYLAIGVIAVLVTSGFGC
jgi:hypothetical protein